MGEPAISVLLPVYNAEPYIREAVESVLSQTFTDFEFVILDDGSTDHSLAILREYEPRDARITLITRDNRGIVASLNDLIGHSRGEYIARMDGDDICRPRRFQKQVDFLSEHRECVAVGSRVLLIDDARRPITKFVDKFTHAEIDEAHMSGSGGSRICHPSAMMRREAVIAVGAYRKEFEHAEDLDLFLRMAEIGQLANIPDILLEYRQHLSSIGYANAMEQTSAADRISRRANSFSKPETPCAVHRKWAWWALIDGNVSTARRYAFKALMAEPLNLENIKLAACAMRGR